MKRTNICETVLEKRYLRHKEDGTRETPAEMNHRVTLTVSAVDAKYGASPEQVAQTELEFYEAIDNQDFEPNSPTFTGAGTSLGQLSACFVLPVADSLSDIYQTMKEAALIHQTGGGTGFAFSRLRPSGDKVRTSQGVASGPVSFLKVYNSSTEAIKQGGTRRGANMGILRVDHPDILEFIEAKRDTTQIQNFNISIGITDAFMAAFKSGGEYDLINPRTGEPMQKLPAQVVWNLLVDCAWASGEPGVVFIDRMNRRNPNNNGMIYTHVDAAGVFHNADGLPVKEPIEATNPCGEQPLPPHGSCNLGSINLANFVLNSYTAQAGVDWDRLAAVTRTATHFLDNVIDANKYPLEQIAQKARGDRRIGLGIMGWAEMLVQMGFGYDSDEAVDLATKVMSHIKLHSKLQSIEMAASRGVYPEWEGSLWHKAGVEIRNATLTTIAPTGTISLFAAQSEHKLHVLTDGALLGMPCSGGCEPKFALVFTRNQAGALMLDIDQQFEFIARSEGWYSDELMKQIEEHGTARGVAGVPEKWQMVFSTSHDIAPVWHVKMQAAFQGGDHLSVEEQPVDAAVSKTINFPNDATRDEVEQAYTMAWDLGLKGITVYRDGSRAFQVLTSGNQTEKKNDAPAEVAPVDAEAIGEVASEMHDASRMGESVPAATVDMWSKQLAAYTSGAPIEKAPAPQGPQLKPRPSEGNGKVFVMNTHFGNMTLDVHMDDNMDPYEVIVSVGAAGSDLMADAVGMGMLVSKLLRLRSDVPVRKRVEIVIDTLKNIGGSGSYGFGPNRVTSLASAIAKGLQRFVDWQDQGTVMVPVSNAHPHEAEAVNPMAGGSHDKVDHFEPCPECGSHALGFTEGCATCHNCGYSKCS